MSIHAYHVTNSIQLLCNYIDNAGLANEFTQVEFLTFPKKVWITIDIGNSGSNSVVDPAVELFGSFNASSGTKIPLALHDLQGDVVSSTTNGVVILDGVGSSSVSFVLIKPPPVVYLKVTATSLPASFNGSAIRGTATWR